MIDIDYGYIEELGKNLLLIDDDMLVVIKNLDDLRDRLNNSWDTEAYRVYYDDVNKVINKCIKDWKYLDLFSTTLKKASSNFSLTEEEISKYINNTNDITKFLKVDDPDE